jgi:hypothetical protein
MHYHASHHRRFGQHHEKLSMRKFFAPFSRLFPFSSLLIVGTALLLVACQTAKPVATDYNPEVDFSSFRQFAWKDDTSGSDKEFDPLLSQRVHDALNSGLTARQYTAAATPANADFLVRYYIKTDEATEESKTRGGISIGGFGSNVGLGVGMSFPIGPKVIEQRAQILVDFINNKDQKLAWRGNRRLVLRGETPNAMSDQINVAIEEILSEFPPK